MAPSDKFSPGRDALQDSLLKVLSSKVFDALDEGVGDCLLDYMAIRAMTVDCYIISPNSIGDYSYLVLPAFKALEGFLLQVASALGMNPEEYDYRVGQMLQEENIEKLYQDVISKVEEIDQEQKLDIKTWLSNARLLLRSYRHTPAHYWGDKLVSWEKAIQHGDYIIETIDRMGRGLLAAGRLEKIASLEDIPF